MRHAKRSTSRDFKIQVQKEEGLNRKESQQEVYHDREDVNDASSENESDKCEGVDEESASEKILTGGPEDDGSEREEDEEVPVRKKRVMSSAVVEDSDDEVQVSL